MTLGKIVWMTGLPCSGKTTLARELVRRIRIWTPHVCHLDGDTLRHTPISLGLGFSPEDRETNLLRAATIARLMSDAGVHTVASFITPSLSTRGNIRHLIRAHPFHLFYVHASKEICIERDVKGMWAKAAAGEIKGFTGYDAPYEAPKEPEQHTVVDTNTLTVRESADVAMGGLGWRHY